LSAAPRAREGASDAPCRARFGGASPSGERAPGPPSPPSRQGGRLFRPGAPSAGMRSRACRLLQSRTIHEHGRESRGPRAAGPKLPSYRTAWAAPPLSRHRRGCFTAQGSRSRPSPRPTPHQAHLVGLPQNRSARAPPVARFRAGPAGEADLARARGPRPASPRPACAGRAGSRIARATACRKAGSVRSSAKRGKTSPSPGCLRTMGSLAFRLPLFHRLLPTCGWIAGVAAAARSDF